MEPDFNKNSDGLLPAIVQDVDTQKVLMLGYMDSSAYHQTVNSGKVTFYSRSKKRLWVKGETSGNFLLLDSILADCDRDSLLVKATPAGPVCHTNADTCFNEVNIPALFLTTLENIIGERKNTPNSTSYTSRLFEKGINKIAQKVGEEAVELVIEAKDDNDELFKNEAADLLYHYLILLQAKNFTLADIDAVLKGRHNK